MTEKSMLIKFRGDTTQKEMKELRETIENHNDFVSSIAIIEENKLGAKNGKNKT